MDSRREFLAGLGALAAGVALGSGEGDADAAGVARAGGGRSDGARVRTSSGAGGSGGGELLSGHGVPRRTLGKTGDFYLDCASTSFYGPKRAGKWGAPLLVARDVEAAASRVFDVLTYGAIGNGKHDDSAAIQTAIDAAGTAGGGVVLLRSARYRISRPLRLAHTDVQLRGSGGAFWSAGGSVLMPAGPLAGGLSGGAAVQITADRCGLDGVSFAPASGSPSTLAISIAGTSSDPCNGVTLTDVQVAGLGGISATNAERLRFDNVDCQAWYGQCGIELANCSIVYLHDCNSAAAGQGSATDWTWNYRIAGCESVILFGCESNNNPYWGVWIEDTSDSKWYDLECNGANAGQIQIQGGNDNQFNNLYVYGASQIGLHAYNTSRLQLQGGWISGAGQSQVVLESCAWAQVSGAHIEAATGQNCAEVTDDGAIDTDVVQISDCVLQLSDGVGVLLAGSASATNVQLTDNIITGSAGSGSGTTGTGIAFDGSGIFRCSMVTGTLMAALATGIAFSSGNFSAGDTPALVNAIQFRADVTTPISQITTTGQPPLISNCGGYDLTTASSGTPIEIAGTTAGSAALRQPLAGADQKQVMVYLDGYENTTATAQAITFPTPFTVVPAVVAAPTGANPAVTRTGIALPTSTTSTLTGLVILEGF